MHVVICAIVYCCFDCSVVVCPAPTTTKHFKTTISSIHLDLICVNSYEISLHCNPIGVCYLFYGNVNSLWYVLFFHFCSQLGFIVSITSLHCYWLVIHKCWCNIARWSGQKKSAGVDACCQNFFSFFVLSKCHAFSTPNSCKYFIPSPTRII